MYKNPLHIIPSDKVDDLTSTKLKCIKKELLLRFELSHETTVEINGREYDKNAVLETFEDLKTDIDYHIKVLKHPKLLAFLEHGKMDFFKTRRGLLILHDPEFKEWLKPHFIMRLSRIYYQAVTNKGFSSIHVLEDLQKSTFQVPLEWEDAVFAHTFKFLNNYITEIENRFIVPVLADNPRKLKPEIADYVDVFYMNIYKHLPKERFANLKYRYGIWCNQIVYKIFKEKTEVARIDRNSLKILNASATIAAEVFNPKGNKQIAKTISSYLYNGGSVKKSASPWGVIYFVVVLLIFLIRMANCSNNNRSSHYDYTKHNNHYTDKSNSSYNNKTLFNALIREMKLRSESYGVSNMNEMTVRKSTSPSVMTTDVLTVASSYNKKYNIEGEIYRENPEQKITDFSAFIRPQKDEFKYRIAGYGNSIDTLQLSNLKSSDFINGPSFEGKGKTRLQQVKAALSNFFILQGMEFKYGKTVQQLQLNIGTMTGFKHELATAEWIESPYENLYLIKINSTHYTALYYIDATTKVVYKMQFLGTNTKMTMTCRES